MAARTFEDSTGAVWEVFEVHRTSSKSGAVSSGLEAGWLAFVSGDHKRRLAPYPREWEAAEPSELSRLCQMARIAPIAKFPLEIGERRRAPRDAPPPVPIEMASTIEGAKQVEAELETENHSDVEQAVRTFAHHARTTGLPAIEAMVQLKLLLIERFPGAGSMARDLRRVRRWFVEAFYFEREA